MIAQSFTGMLKNLFLAIADREEIIEKHRQRLANIKDFDPFITFLHIDVDKDQRISVDELFSYLKANSANVQIENCEALVRFFDSSNTGALTFNDYVQVLLPCSNDYLRDLAAQKKSENISMIPKLSENTNKELCELLKQEVEYHKDVETCKTDLLNHPEYSPDKAFQFLDINRQGFLDDFSIKSFLAQHGFNASEQDITSIIRRMDVTADARVSYNEFIEAMAPAKPIKIQTHNEIRQPIAHRIHSIRGEVSQYDKIPSFTFAKEFKNSDLYWDPYHQRPQLGYYQNANPRYESPTIKNSTEMRYTHQPSSYLNRSPRTQNRFDSYVQNMNVGQSISETQTSLSRGYTRQIPSSNLINFSQDNYAAQNDARNTASFSANRNYRLDNRMQTLNHETYERNSPYSKPLPSQNHDLAASPERYNLSSPSRSSIHHPIEPFSKNRDIRSKYSENNEMMPSRLANSYSQYNTNMNIERPKTDSKLLNSDIPQFQNNAYPKDVHAINSMYSGDHRSLWNKGSMMDMDRNRLSYLPKGSANMNSDLAHLQSSGMNQPSSSHPSKMQTVDHSSYYSPRNSKNRNIGGISDVRNKYKSGFSYHNRLQSMNKYESPYRKYSQVNPGNPNETPEKQSVYSKPGQNYSKDNSFAYMRSSSRTNSTLADTQKDYRYGFKSSIYNDSISKRPKSDFRGTREYNNYIDQHASNDVYANSLQKYQAYDRNQHMQGYSQRGYSRERNYDNRSSYYREAKNDVMSKYRSNAHNFSRPGTSAGTGNYINIADEKKGFADDSKIKISRTIEETKTQSIPIANPNESASKEAKSSIDVSKPTPGFNMFANPEIVSSAQKTGGWNFVPSPETKKTESKTGAKKSDRSTKEKTVKTPIRG